MGHHSLSESLFGLKATHATKKHLKEKAVTCITKLQAPVEDAEMSDDQETQAATETNEHTTDDAQTSADGKTSKDGKKQKGNGKNQTERDPEELRRTIIVKNLTLDVKEKTLIKLLNLSKDQVESIRFRSLPVDKKFAKNKVLGLITKSYVSEKATKHAYVVLARDVDIDLVLSNTGIKHEGKTLFIDRAKQPGKFTLFDRINTVFVGRLPHKYTEDDLFKLFSEVAEVRNVRIVRDPATHISKGFGFVCFTNKAAVPQAISIFKKKEVDGHPLRVTRPLKEDEAAEQKKKAEAKRSKASSGRKTVEKPKPKAVLKGAARRVAKKSGKGAHKA